jgi:protein-serine/threonine kinase
LERERERIKESQPKATLALQHGQDDNDNAAAPPPVVHMHEAQDESRRSGRSRHDHSKREKSSRFGEYYLGNTIGEGEFGKVKLGWKQDGGVQVRKCDQ